jgi:hypothetical protein
MHWFLSQHRYPHPDKVIPSVNNDPPSTNTTAYRYFDKFPNRKSAAFSIQSTSGATSIMKVLEMAIDDNRDIGKGVIMMRIVSFVTTFVFALSIVSDLWVPQNSNTTSPCCVHCWLYMRYRRRERSIFYRWNDNVDLWPCCYLPLLFRGCETQCYRGKSVEFFCWMIVEFISNSF